MRKITLLLTLVLTANVLFAQNLTTGVISSPFSFGRTVKFDVNTATNVVTMTMVLPENKWFGVAFSNDAGGILLGDTMGNADDDVIVGVNTGVEDRNMRGNLFEPPLDVSEDWTVVSNLASGGMRTIIATRDRDTGDVEDFVFPNTTGALPMLYAQGNSPTIAYHDEGRGFFMASLSEEVLSVNDFESTSISLHPNPVTSILKINASIQDLDNLSVEVFNILGEKVFNKSLNKNDAQISVSDWSNGVYILKISSTNNQSIIKRFVKI